MEENTWYEITDISGERLLSHFFIMSYFSGMGLSSPILCMRRETRRPLLMGYVDEFTAQSRLYASDGLSSEVMSACEPFGDFGISLIEQSGKILLGESLGFKYLTNALGNTKRQIKLCLLLGRYRSKAITE